MLPDRSWIYRRLGPNGVVTDEFKEGINQFITFAESRIHNALWLCPCAKCMNRRSRAPLTISGHLWNFGFQHGYENWTFHGEELWSSMRETTRTSDVQNENPYVDMLMEGISAHEEIPVTHELEEDTPNSAAAKFFELLRKAEEPLWDGCETFTVLSAVVQLLNWKSEFNVSASCFDRLLSIIKKMLPVSERLPENFYRTKRMTDEMGLKYCKIDACSNDCMLFDGENISLTHCTICGEERFVKNKVGEGKRKSIPRKILRYFPITQRLQRLYMSTKTSQEMRWHAEGVRHRLDVMSHPSDAEAWKHFDLIHPQFAMDVRNVRIGLSTDGFSPFTMSLSKYSCWPVFVTVYNLPPSMCMKKESIFLALIIPGPTSPGNDIDVYLRPLVNELKQLWEIGVQTYDSYARQNFMMRTALLWTISDFPAYGMLSGWSTHGRLACPYCMGECDAFQLPYSRKTSWFDCHRRFLPANHVFRRNRDGFLKGRRESREPVNMLSGEDIFSELQRFTNITFGKKNLTSIPGKGLTHNWRKVSIFWELPYWRKNLIRHNLDVMHIEKNFFDNVYNTVMNMKGKTKDTLNAREDLKQLCRRKDLEVYEKNGRLVMPKAKYVLTKDQVKDVSLWLKELKFPDAYVANIGRRVDVNTGRIHGMRSHDCHIFMERLLPLAFRDILNKPDVNIAAVLTELSFCFRKLCSMEILCSEMQDLEQRVILLLCKMERISPRHFLTVWNIFFYIYLMRNVLLFWCSTDGCIHSNVLCSILKKWFVKRKK